MIGIEKYAKKESNELKIVPSLNLQSSLNDLEKKIFGAIGGVAKKQKVDRKGLKNVKVHKKPGPIRVSK